MTNRKNDARRVSLPPSGPQFHPDSVFEWKIVELPTTAEVDLLLVAVFFDPCCV